VIDELQKAFARWQRKIVLMVARGVIELVDDGEGVQKLQLTVNAGALWDGVQRFQEFGFTSTPLPGAEVTVVSIAGLRSHGIVVAVEDRRYRLAGVPGGGVALYDASGATIVLSNDGKITLTAPEVTIAAATKVHMDTPLLEVTGDIKAAGNIVDTSGSNARSMAGMRTIYDEHTHANVQNGPGITAGPDPVM
jgi:phage baseplate assembly protein V